LWRIYDFGFTIYEFRKGWNVPFRRSDGHRLFLYHRNPVGEFPAQPGVTRHIYWLTPDSFDRVCSGRRLSDYVLYQLAPDADAPARCMSGRKTQAVSPSV
jgi:hypothetical protein